jgi:RHS repeat-associated protein
VSMCGTPAGGGAAVCYASNRTEGLDRYGRVAYTEFKLGNNLYNRQSFSGNLGRLASSTVGTTPVGADRLSRSYTYDAIGNINTIVDPLASQTHTYGYDHLDRLTAWSVTGSNPTSESYSYDTIGNITAKTGIAGGYTYPAAGQARPHAPTAVGGQSYSYDANGNLTSGGGRTLTWDYDNKPATVTPAGGSIFTAESYQYGPDGERIKKTVGNVTTYYFGLLEEEVNSGTGVTTRRLQYKWGGSVIAQREKVGTGVETVVYLSGDHLGSVSVATNASGGYVNPGSPQQLFDPWGKVRTGTLTSTTTLNYTGQKLDATGLLFYNARYYDPSIAKFISADIIVPNESNPQSYNRYAYVISNPLRYTDPTGNCEQEGDDDCWDKYNEAAALNGGKLPNGFAELDVDQLTELIKWLKRGIRFKDGTSGNTNASWRAETIMSVLYALDDLEGVFGAEQLDRMIGIDGKTDTLTFILVQAPISEGAAWVYNGDSEIFLNFALFDPVAIPKGQKLWTNKVIHELGHIVDKRAGLIRQVWGNPYVRAWSQGSDWLSSHIESVNGPRHTGEAERSPTEDYAETFLWYVSMKLGKTEYTCWCGKGGAYTVVNVSQNKPTSAKIASLERSLERFEK